MRAWQAAKQTSQAARNRQLSQTASDEDDIAKQILLRQLAGMFRRYKFDDQKCFFCGERGHHTGHLTAPVWLCKSPACATQYRIAKEDV